MVLLILALSSAALSPHHWVNSTHALYLNRPLENQTLGLVHAKRVPPPKKDTHSIKKQNLEEKKKKKQNLGLGIW